MSKITWNDIYNATPKELMKSYKIGERQLENQLRRHLDGANATERRQVYQKMYDKKP